MKTWKVIKLGEVSENARKIPYSCPGCGVEAELPVMGLAIAQSNNAVIFDRGDHALPDIIQCRSCRRRFEYVR